MAEETLEREDQSTVQALERGLKSLELLMQEKRPMGVNEIAKCHGITPSAAYRILKTPESTGRSFQMSDDKYIPGEKLSFVTEKNNFHLALGEVVYPAMQELTVREQLAYYLPQLREAAQAITQKLFLPREQCG